MTQNKHKREAISCMFADAFVKNVFNCFILFEGSSHFITIITAITSIVIYKMIHYSYVNNIYCFPSNYNLCLNLFLSNYYYNISLFT